MSFKIGFIGLGIMGLPMAENLLRAGFSLNVYNRTAGKADALVAAGATRANSPADAAVGADVVISIVSRTSDVQEVLLGSNEMTAPAVNSLKPGAVFIDMSTIDVDATKQMANRLESIGVTYLDAPVSGGEKGAIEGTLTIFVGGDEAIFSKVKPILDAVGKTTTYMGNAGAGQAAKACNQILVSAAVLATAEALNFGREQGLDMHQLIRATSGGSAQSWVLENLGTAMANGHFDPGFMVDLMQKDLGMVMATAKEQGLSVSSANLASEHFQTLQHAGRGAEGMQALYRCFDGSMTDGSMADGSTV